MDWILQTKSSVENVTLEKQTCRQTVVNSPYMKTFLSYTDISLLGTKSSLLTRSH